MNGTILEQIKISNERYRTGQAKPLDDSGPPFLVVTCIDPRLTSFLEPALGLPRSRAVVIRTAGNRISAQTLDVMRSIAAALYIKRAAEIFVVGHTDCALTHFSAPEVIEAFRKEGIARSAFGDADLREWFGAFPDVKANVLSGVDFLRRSPLIPRSLKVHGLVINLADATLDVAVNGDTAIPAEIVPAVEAGKPAVPQPPVAAKAESPSGAIPQIPSLPGRGKPAPVVIAEDRGPSGIRTDSVPVPQTMMDAILALREVLLAERSNPVMKRQFAELSTLVRKERNAVKILGALETAFKGAEQRHPQLPGIYAFLRTSLGSHGGGTRVIEFVRRIVD